MTATRSSCVTCAVLTSLLILSSIVNTAEGKCSGKWAIHACWGGNGKRSGIPAPDDSTKSLDLLQRLLLRRNPSPYLPPLEDTVFVPLQPEDLFSSLQSSSSPSSSQPAFEKRFSEDEDASLVSSRVRLDSLKRILRRLQHTSEDFA